MRLAKADVTMSGKSPDITVSVNPKKSTKFLFLLKQFFEEKKRLMLMF